jgi:hypothetical protein
MELVPCTEMKKKTEEFIKPTILNIVLHTSESKYLQAILDAIPAWRENVKQGIGKHHPSSWLAQDSWGGDLPQG